MDFKELAINLISQNPRFANNPQAQNYLRVIQSGDAQTDSIVSQLRPAAVPAYQVPNPWQGYMYGGCGCGCGAN